MRHLPRPPVSSGVPGTYQGVAGSPNQRVSGGLPFVRAALRGAVTRGILVPEVAAMEPTYTVVLREEPEGGFTVLVPALPEIVSYGETIEEARRMAADAIRCAVLGRQDDGEPIPEEEGRILSLPAAERTGDLYLCRCPA